MTANMTAPDYDSVELRAGRLYRVRRCVARLLGDEDGMVPVTKCYCRSNDVLTPAEVEMQKRPSFIFPVEYFRSLESLIGKELEGRIYWDSQGRRVRFHLDLSEHAGFQHGDDGRSLRSPWYDDGALNE